MITYYNYNVKYFSKEENDYVEIGYTYNTKEEAIEAFKEMRENCHKAYLRKKDDTDPRAIDFCERMIKVYNELLDTDIIITETKYTIETETKKSKLKV